MSAAAYGEYVTIDEHLAKVEFRSGTDIQEPNPHEIINMQWTDDADGGYDQEVWIME